MWIDVRDKDVVLPSMSKVILVTDGQRHQLLSVEKFLETVDTPYNTWTHWMEIPKIEDKLISEEELDELAKNDADVYGLLFAEHSHHCQVNRQEGFYDGFKAGCKLMFKRLS